MFQLFGRDTIDIDSASLCRYLFSEKSRKFEKIDIDRCLRNEFRLERSEIKYFKIPQYHTDAVTDLHETAEKEGLYVVEQTDKFVLVDQNGEEKAQNPKAKFIKFKGKTGRPFTFYAEDFL